MKKNTHSRLGRAGGFFLSLLSLTPLLLLTAAATATAAVDLPEETVEGWGILDSPEDDKYLSPGSVTVVRPADFEGEQRTLPDFLEEVPGLRVIRLQGRHGYAVASVRGSTSAQVAVYVDGVLMNLQSEAAVDLSAIPVDSVERIEVYKGYVPSRFGAQAMGGVINIVTKTPGRPETFLSLGAGSFGRFKGTVSRAVPLWGGKLFGSFGYETYDGDFKYRNDGGTPYNNADDYEGRRRENGFENTDMLLKWEDEHWKARASWVRRNRELALRAPGRDKPGASQANAPLLDTDRLDLSAGGNQAWGGVNWGWEVAYTRQEKDYYSRSGASDSDFGPANVKTSEYGTSRIGFSLNADWAVGERHFFEFLGDYSEEKLKVRGDSLFQYLGGIDSYSRRDWSLGLQDTVTLDRAGTLLLTPSVRRHKLTDEDHFTWQLALTKERLFGLPGFMLKGALGTYARAPNTYEQYGDGAFIIPAARDLEWETGKQIDAGILWNGRLEGMKGLRDADVSVSLSAFWRDSKNLIEFDMESPRYGRYKNIAKAEVKGIEAEASAVWEKWAVSFAVTWMEGENKTYDPGSVRSVGLPLPNRPEWNASARVTRRFSPRGARNGSVFAEYRYTGENYADESAKVIFGARGVVNAGARYELSPTANLTVGIDDLFNDSDGWRMMPETLNGPTRMLWYPAEGRTFYLTLDIKF